MMVTSVLVIVVMLVVCCGYKCKDRSREKRGERQRERRRKKRESLYLLFSLCVCSQLFALLRFVPTSNGEKKTTAAVASKEKNADAAFLAINRRRAPLSLSLFPRSLVAI